ncbi:MAG TPA: class I SAM-dependent methyltransferase [Ruminococcaceae bacterium]|nr:class I SAM-dependent methyltransferase [Oscillospiraceae bacterium]
MSGYGDFSAVYDGLTDNVEYEKRAKYIHHLLKKGGISDGLMLDLACGTGRLSCEMAKLGYEVIGVDASGEMLSIAMNNANENGVDILFLCQEMQNLDLFGTIRSAICTLDSINHLTDPEDVKKTFAGVSLFTEPGGLFVFDVNTPYKHREILANNTFVYDTDEVYCVWQNTLEPDTDTVAIALDIFEQEDDGAYFRTQESFCERAYSVQDLSDWLKEAGFDEINIYDELTEDEPKADSQRLFIIARKK